MTEGKKAAATTLGCKVNFYETEAILALFREDGYEIVDFSEKADVYIINTCTVTNVGDKKSRQLVRRARNQNENAVICVAGCFAQVNPEDAAGIEGVSLVLGTKDRSRILTEVNRIFADGTLTHHKPVNLVSDVMDEKAFDELPVAIERSRSRAFVKIQDGCGRFCSYCVIPYARGPARSRDPEDGLNEMRLLARAGYKEIVLTGIHIASFGKDLTGSPYEKNGLIEFLKRADEISGIRRIRMSSIEPNIIDSKFTTEIKNLEKICPHFHVSLQSGCDETLKRMNRRYDSAMYRESVSILREIPGMAVTTDMITGFPMETEEEFEESLSFAAEMKFMDIHVFPYSAKKGTKAADMQGQVPKSVKEARAERLITLAREMNLDFLNRHIGEEIEVLFEQSENGGRSKGHTGNYIPVIAKLGSILENELRSVTAKSVILGRENVIMAE